MVLINAQWMKNAKMYNFTIKKPVLSIILIVSKGLYARGKIAIELSKPNEYLTSITNFLSSSI